MKLKVGMKFNAVDGSGSMVLTDPGFTLIFKDGTVRHCLHSKWPDEKGLEGWVLDGAYAPRARLRDMGTHYALVTE